MSDWKCDPREAAPADESLGIELHRLFDAEKENLPPLFFETLQLSRGIEKEIAGCENLEEDVLRRFFRRIGWDYDAWYRQKQRRRRRRIVLVSVVFFLTALAAVLFSSPPVLEALRRPLLQWFRQAPTPITERNVTRYAQVSDIQPYFSVPLPQSPPAGFRLVSVALEQGFPAGPRAMIFYQCGDPSHPDDHGAEVHLVVWSLQDEPFPFPVEAIPEAVELDGQPASWVAGTGRGSGQVWRPAGGWLFWEREGWKFALVSSTLSRDELVRIGRQLVGQ